MTDVREVFTEHGLRCTRQREELYRALAGTTLHPTAEELFISALRDDPGLSLATVYNTLEVFTRVGLCRKIATPNGPARYDACTAEHVHLVKPDGRILDVPEDLSRRLLAQLPESLVREVERRLGVALEGVNVQLVQRAEPVIDERE